MGRDTGRSASGEDTTGLLRRWSEGDSSAGERALYHLYPDLLSYADRRLKSWDLTLQPSDLVQEVCLRLQAQRSSRWQNRAHFFAIVARMLRRVLSDQVLARGRLKRGRQMTRRGLEEVDPQVAPASLDHLALDQALERLAIVDPIAARTVELRYFAGLSFDDTAATLEVSKSTVVRRWRFARSWLYLQLKEVDDD